MAIYIDGKSRIKDIFVNVNGEKKKITSTWGNKNGVPAKVFSNKGKPSLGITWTDSTYEEIARVLESHYNGEIDISEHWHVGDEKVVHLSAMSSWDSTYGEAQPEQDVTLVIIGFNLDTLRTPINGISKSAITVQVKRCLQNQGVIDADYIKYNNNFTSCTLEWVACDRRKWCNNTFKNSLPSQLSELIKVVKKTNYKVSFSGSPSREEFTKEDDNFKTPNSAYDSCFLLTSDEVGLPDVSGAIDPAYPYFNDNTREKGRRWWLRKPSWGNDVASYLSWQDISGYRNGAQFIYNQAGIAPAFCL